MRIFPALLTILLVAAFWAGHPTPLWAGLPTSPPKRPKVSPPTTRLERHHSEGADISSLSFADQQRVEGNAQPESPVVPQHRRLLESRLQPVLSSLKAVLQHYFLRETIAAAKMPPPKRTWTDADGQFQVEAEMLDCNGGKVWLKRDDNRLFAIPLADLRKADQDYARQETQRCAATFSLKAPNGHTAFDYGPPRKLAELADPQIVESSGLAPSRTAPGIFWTHNDSGDSGRLYAFDARGKALGGCRLRDTIVYDLEDIASFKLDGKSYLLAADIGNNGLAAPVQILYLIEEPPVDANAADVITKVSPLQIMCFSYEDDHRDSEALAVDPTSRKILLATKERARLCRIYALAWPKNDPNKATTARKIATLALPPVTAMDISPDGRRAVLLTYGDAFEYFRGPDEDWATAFARPPRRLPMPLRSQGESICYGADGKTLYLTSEQRPTPLWEVPVQE